LRVAIIVLALSTTVPIVASAQSTDSSRAPSRQTVFSIQPRTGDLGNPRLELERAVTQRVSVVLGSGLTLRNPAYAVRNTVVSELDLGARYYPGGRAFHGAFVGAHAGYERLVKGYTFNDRVRVPRAFIGATVGYDFVVYRRLIIGPAFGLEYGRPSFDGGHSFVLRPRIGIGFNFE
jgi:hypothetical protein